MPLTDYVRKSKWCEKHGWTGPYYREGNWYAFPPNAFISQKIPQTKWELIGSLSRFFILVIFILVILVTLSILLLLTHPEIIGIITAVIAAIKISDAINQIISREPASENFMISTWVSFTGFLALLIFNYIFNEYQNLYLDRAISMNGVIFCVSFACALISYLFDSNKR